MRQGKIVRHSFKDPAKESRRRRKAKILAKTEAGKRRIAGVLPERGFGGT